MLSPIVAAVLIGMCFLKTWEVLGIGLGGMLVRDIVLGFDAMTPVRLLAVFATVGAARLARVRLGLGPLVLGLLAATPVFHLVIASGAWAVGMCEGFPNTPAGLWQSIVTTVPYFLISLAWQIGYTLSFAAVFALARAWVMRRHSTLKV
ncbi:MAG: hypothetical protein HYY14_00605 [Candidatus Omnitrophica bacterium]|nr:hypothetical protein [Candidatus Omnitrophota bacterium]